MQSTATTSLIPLASCTCGHQVPVIARDEDGTQYTVSYGYKVDTIFCRFCGYPVPLVAGKTYDLPILVFPKPNEVFESKRLQYTGYKIGQSIGNLGFSLFPQAVKAAVDFETQLQDVIARTEPPKRERRLGVDSAGLPRHENLRAAIMPTLKPEDNYVYMAVDSSGKLFTKANNRGNVKNDSDRTWQNAYLNYTVPMTIDGCPISEDQFNAAITTLKGGQPYAEGVVRALRHLKVNPMQGHRNGESRPTFDAVWMEVARTVARRSTCPRLQVGAVLVDDDNQIISTGYNGAAKGMSHCDDVGCDIEKETGRCKRTVHAEINALLQGPNFTGTTLYVTHLPCTECTAIICNTGIERIVYGEQYGSASTNAANKRRLKEAGIHVEQASSL